jgi:hypothetical protein
LGLGLGHFGITQGQWVKEFNDFKIGKKFEGLEREKKKDKPAKKFELATKTRKNVEFSRTR